MHHVKEFILDNKDKIFDSISAIGLIFDMVGVYLLFILKDSYFDKLKFRIKVNQRNISHNDKASNVASKYIESFRDTFNKMIDRITLENQETSKKASKAMVLILVGFGLQLLVYLFRIIG